MSEVKENVGDIDENIKNIVDDYVKETFKKVVEIVDNDGKIEKREITGKRLRKEGYMLFINGMGFKEREK